MSKRVVVSFIVGIIMILVLALIEWAPGTFFQTAVIKKSPPLSDNMFCLHEEAGNDMTKVTLRAHNIKEKLLGIGFTLNYDAQKLKFIKYAAGTFFERGGVPLYIVKNAQQKSEVISGISLKRDDLLVSGSGTVMTFAFEQRQKGDAHFSLERIITSTLYQGKRKDLKNIRFENCLDVI